MLDRIRSVAAAVVLLAASAWPALAEEALTGIAYLESLKGKADYLAPSEIDPRYTMALYANVGGGANRQRMWVLQRDAEGGPWRLAMWDEAYWKKKKLAEGATPPFSWLVSSGRKYPGDERSGPTPQGVYNLDERKRRVVMGYAGDGMIHAAFIDYHYRDGRRSGVAFHGTTPGRYGRLGSIDSHGCIRMHQRNAIALIRRLLGKDGALSEAQRWGEVPRFWQSESGLRRLGYRRDGLPAVAAGEPASAAAPAGAAQPSTAVVADASGQTAPAAAPDPAAAAPLTKTGYRVLAVLFAE